ncbi:HD domain protein [mine drainage metagenome]|uniref:HD domain protein n=1 Tax=mine drainage metagenome TaxID=410659 RepID=A0A1J5PWI0_9ZZZZ
MPVSHAAIPLMVDNAIFGAIAVASADPDAFASGEVAHLAEFADMLGSVLNAWQARHGPHAVCQTLQPDLTHTVQALATAAEFHDPYTASHQRHVAALSVAIAQEMNLSANEIEGLRFAALLHDIGKIAVPLVGELQAAGFGFPFGVCAKAGV